MVAISREMDVLTRTVYDEARGETRLGKIAVAWVIINRAAKGGWWGSDIISVCVKNKQFSGWNSDAPNRAEMLSVDMDDPVFRDCYEATFAAFQEQVKDPTDGATHFHTHAVSPAWAKGKQFIAIGGHRFYRNID